MMTIPSSLSLLDDVRKESSFLPDHPIYSLSIKYAS